MSSLDRPNWSPSGRLVIGSIVQRFMRQHFLLAAADTSGSSGAPEETNSRLWALYAADIVLVDWIRSPYLLLYSPSLRLWLSVSDSESPSSGPSLTSTSSAPHPFWSTLISQILKFKFKVEVVEPQISNFLSRFAIATQRNRFNCFCFLFNATAQRLLQHCYLMYCL